MQRKEPEANATTVCIRGDGAEDEDDNISLESWTVLDTTVVIQPSVQVNRAQALVEFIKNDKSFLDTTKEKVLANELVQLATIPETSEQITGCFGAFFRRIQTPDIVSAMADQLYDLFITQNQQLAVTSLKTIITDLPPVDFIRPERALKETKMVMSLIDSLVPRLVGGISKDNITSSLELVSLMLRIHSYFFRNHPKHRNIHFWDNYFCTGIELGKGSYASVYLGRHIKTAKIVAIKSMQWDKLTQGKPKLEEQLRNEIEIMKSSNHPNIVKLYDVVRDGGVMNLILEYCGGGSLEDLLKSKGVISEQDTVYWLKELGLGLKFLRDRGIIHRDLKPGNLLIAVEGGTSHLKITDFTFARFIDPGDLATTLVGTPLYMAPEIFEDHRYTDKADLWSIGVILYQMLTGHIPFSAARAQNYVELINLIKRNELILPPNISSNMKDLMTSLLQKSANLRLSWTEFFVHPCLGIGSMSSGPVDPFSQSGDAETLQRELAELKKELEKLKAKEKLDADTIEGLRTQALESARRAEEARKESERLRAEVDRYKQIDGDWIKQLDREQRISSNLDQEVKLWRERATEGELALQKLRVDHQQELAVLRATLAERTKDASSSSSGKDVSKEKDEAVAAKAKLENDLRLVRSDLELLREENKKLREQVAEEKKKQQSSAASSGVSEQTMATLEVMMETWQKERDRDAQSRDDLLRMYEAQLKQKEKQIEELSEQLEVLRVTMEAEANEHGLKNSFYKVVSKNKPQTSSGSSSPSPSTTQPGSSKNAKNNTKKTKN